MKLLEIKMESENKIIKVAAGIFEIDEKYLITQRKKGTRFGGKWEFPGGTVEPGETYEECLYRELEEELEIKTIIGDFFEESIFDYEDKKIILRAYYAKYQSGKFWLNYHDDAKLIYPFEMRNYDFVEADLPFVDKLINLND